MSLAISSRVAASICRAAAESPAAEVCGLLVGDRRAITSFIACRNVAADPRCSFEIDPGQLIAALRADRDGGPAVVGCYHSHPGGRLAPSARDAAAADANGWIWLITAHDAIACWRAVADGACEGRFAAVAHHVF